MYMYRRYVTYLGAELGCLSACIMQCSVQEELALCRPFLLHILARKLQTHPPPLNPLIDTLHYSAPFRSLDQLL